MATRRPPISSALYSQKVIAAIALLFGKSWNLQKQSQIKAFLGGESEAANGVYKLDAKNGQQIITSLLKLQT